MNNVRKLVFGDSILVLCPYVFTAIGLIWRTRIFTVNMCIVTAFLTLDCFEYLQFCQRINLIWCRGKKDFIYFKEICFVTVFVSMYVYLSLFM